MLQTSTLLGPKHSSIFCETCFTFSCFTFYWGEVVGTVASGRKIIPKDEMLGEWWFGTEVDGQNMPLQFNSTILDTPFWKVYQAHVGRFVPLNISEIICVSLHCWIPLFLTVAWISSFPVLNSWNLHGVDMPPKEDYWAGRFGRQVPCQLCLIAN